jgi:hypothetical protein
MAVRFDAGADFLYRASSLPLMDAVSFACWLYLVTDRNTGSGIFTVINAAGTVYEVLSVGLDGTSLAMYNSSNLGGAAGSQLTVGGWQHVAYTRGPSSHIAYLNGVQDSTLTENLTVTTGGMYIGSDTVNPTDSRMAAIKIWDAQLSAAEVVQEMQTIRPQRFANLHIWTPAMVSSGERSRDYSGNGRDWIEQGTLTDEDGPPVSWGALSRIVSAPARAQDTPELYGRLGLKADRQMRQLLAQ